jgi:glycosyltransferase involved in cell wall biosynthesis
LFTLIRYAAAGRKPARIQQTSGTSGLTDLPSISVAMSVYNCERYLALAIESILAQTVPDFEFLIVNDGSKDNSAQIIDGYAARDARIRPIHRENRGLIASLNQLLAEARAPLVARMDGDDIACPERFARQLAFMRDRPDYGVVSTWTHDIDADGNPSVTRDFEHPTNHAGFLEALHHSTPLCHPSVMYRRDLVLGIGGYHAAFKHCEDYDLWLRLADVTKLCSLPERLMHYRRTDDQVSNRHIVEQQTNAAIAYLAWLERRAGRRDPTADLLEMPPIDALDDLFERKGMTGAVRARVAQGVIYSRTALTSRGLDIVIDHIESGGECSGMWRAVVRLLRFGEPARAMRLAAALAGSMLGRQRQADGCGAVSTGQVARLHLGED